MEKEKIGFFEEDVNVKSSTRLNSFLLLLFTMGFNLMWIYGNSDLTGNNDLTGNLLIFNSLLLTGVFAPKYLHKIIEAKIGDLTQSVQKPNEQIVKEVK